MDISHRSFVGHEGQRAPVADSGAMASPVESAHPPSSVLSDAAEAADAHDADSVLMTAYAQGDAAAFDVLYARHEVGLYRFVRRLLGRDLLAQADEVFQDTWLRVIQSCEHWSPQGATFRTWLYTIAHHRVIDQLRKSGREVALPDDGDAGAPFSPSGAPWLDWPAAAPAPGAEDRMFWRRAGERLLQCLDELPLAQRSAFLLHHDDGLSLLELARLLGLNPETAKSRLRYAMSKLRMCMGAYLPPAWGG